ncbi:hypothetical protein BsWGS_08061 [Bradybaena similaris]
MRKKISTGLIATNGDGKPSIRPPIPASWCQSASATLTGSEIEEVKSASGHTQLREIMSSENGSGEPSPEDHTPSVNGTSNAMSDLDDQTNTNLDNGVNSGNNNRLESSESQCVIPPVFDSVSQNLPTINNPNPAMSEDSNVDVETEEQNTPGSNNMQDIEREEAVSNADAVSSRVDQDRDEQDDDSEMSDAQYIEKQVVESFLNVTSNDLHSISSKNGAGLPKSASSASDNSLYKLSARHEKGLSSVGESLDMSISGVTKSEKILDAVSMTIASVAAGQGGPPEFLSKTPSDRHREDRVTFQHNQTVSKHNFSPLSAEKVKHEKSMSASARLPVISSLLAPSSSASHTATLPGIHHIASRGKISSSPTTVLPSVAHFLGPAKSPPIAYTSRQSSTDVYGTPLTTTSADNNDSVHLSGHYQTSAGGHLPTNTTHSSSSKSKSSRKPVTPAGLRLSLAASEELPDPLPVPQYSDKVIRAKQLGTVAFDRPTVLRETVQFFLQFKHYWSSHDYDRISNLVIELFPEFKDNSDTPGVPANKRIRTDLSMYARNFRRREVSQRKKEGSGFTPNSIDQRSETATSSSQEAGGRLFYSPSSPSNSNGGSVTANSTNNPSDFCNELLTAASIIESQNTASRGRDMGGQISHNHHKVRIADSGSHSQGVAVQKQETVEVDDARRDTYSSHQKSRGETVDDEEDDTPIHFVYDKDTMTATRDASAAWQMYSEQMAQSVAAAGSSGLDYGVSEVYQVEPYTQQAIKKDLGTCARNMRRRLPSAKYKPIPSSQKSWSNSHASLEAQISDGSSVSAAVMPGTAEYMKALMAAQNMNLTELGMTQRNLGELALLAGIKQRIEQYPQEVTDLERQYLAQCSSEEQRQALMASGAFGNDTSAMAALSAFYGLGMDITSSKRGLNSSDYSTASTHDTSSSLAAGELDIPSKRQRRISQAEVEKRLREAELNHSSSHHEDKNHGLSVGVSETHLVKREPMSPAGDGVKSSSKHHQHLSVPISAFPSTSSSSTHDSAYWDTQAATNMALGSMSHSAPQQTAAQAHSQAQIQHLTGHDPTAHPASTEAPMNLTYHESDKHVSHRLTTDSPLPDSLPDTAGLAAQVEVTTSLVKSQSPRRRASSSPRSSHQGDQSVSSRDQVWFPHGAGFKKENQEIVCLPDPLPIPNYSQKILSARAEGSSMRHRSEIIRETARFFLGHKYWWSSADYTRISELVVQQFPDLKDDSSPDGMTSYRRIQRDLSMCARNLRRSKKPRKMRELTSDPSNSLMDSVGTPRTSKKHSKIPKSSLFSSSLEKRQKRSSGISSKIKKIKQESAAAVVSEPSVSAGVSEDMTAAAALLQQQFMQSSSASSYHPSAHLLPSSHLLPSLHTHPSLHEQQMQLSSALLHQQLQESHVSVEEAHSAKRMVKEESSIHEAMEHSYPGAGVKSGTVTPMQRTASPTVEGQTSLNKSGIGHIRSLDGAVINKDDHEKIIQHQAPPPTTMKVYADPDHGNDLQEKFSTLWRKGKFFDASLGVTNKKLHVHKLVLLAMSPYLQETFKNADPRSQLEVNLPSDTTYETAKAFLKYIYEGVLEVDTSSVRSLHKIATMLQMTKLAQYCQNFAQQLQEEADQANGVRAGGEGEIPKISVNLGELAEVQAQRQRHLEAQALQRLGETSSMSSSDLHRTSAARYMSEEHAQLKGEYLTTGDQTSTDQMGGTPHFLHQDVLSQHRALVAASSSLQSSNPSSLLLSSSQDVATQQLIQAALARHQTSSSPQPPPSVSSAMYQHQQHVIAQNDANAALLHRLTSPDTSVTASSASHLDHQQKLAFAAYWQAHTIGELMSRNQVTGLTSDPSSLTSASELAAIAAAAATTTSEDTRHLLSSIGHENKLKTSHSRGHHSKQTSWSSQDTDSSHQATMLPETCMPADMARSHVNSAGGNS